VHPDERGALGLAVAGRLVEVELQRDRIAGGVRRAAVLEVALDLDFGEDCVAVA
jgi:hypothetical protein